MNEKADLRYWKLIPFNWGKSSEIVKGRQRERVSEREREREIERKREIKRERERKRRKKLQREMYRAHREIERILEIFI